MSAPKPLSAEVVRAENERLRKSVNDLLRHVHKCICLRPATYERAMCNLCDECAADPELEWGYCGKEESLLKQAPYVRAARAVLAPEEK